MPPALNTHAGEWGLRVEMFYSRANPAPVPMALVCQQTTGALTRARTRAPPSLSPSHRRYIVGTYAPCSFDKAPESASQRPPSVCPVATNVAMGTLIENAF